MSIYQPYIIAYLQGIQTTNLVDTVKIFTLPGELFFFFVEQGHGKRLQRERELRPTLLSEKSEMDQPVPKMWQDRSRQAHSVEFHALYVSASQDIIVSFPSFAMILYWFHFTTSDKHNA